MGRVVRLHGGPYHGKQVEIVDNRDHIHVVVYEKPQLTEQPDSPAPLPSREGMYSQVQYAPNDFEWDGYRTHD